MNGRLSSESALWIRPLVAEPTVSPVLPTFENDRPIGVHREGFQNYLKHRGSLSLSHDLRNTDQRPSDEFLFRGQARSAKVLGDEARQNYLKNVTSTPQLLQSDYQPPDPHHRLRVKREGRENYVRDHDSRVKLLLENYGQISPPSTPRRPRTQGEVKTKISSLDDLRPFLVVVGEKCL